MQNTTGESGRLFVAHTGPPCRPSSQHPACSKLSSLPGVEDARAVAAKPAGATSRHVTSRHVTSRHVTSRHVTPRHVTPRHATPRHATPRHATPRHVTSRHATGGPGLELELELELRRGHGMPSPEGQQLGTCASPRLACAVATRQHCPGGIEKIRPKFRRQNHHTPPTQRACFITWQSVRRAIHRLSAARSASDCRCASFFRPGSRRRSAPR